MTLTPEQIKDGWKPISEIVNCPDDGIFQLIEPRPHGAFRFHKDILQKSDLQRYYKEYSGHLVFFRPLIPLTPDTIMLSREDAEDLLDVIEAYRSVIEDCKNKPPIEIGKSIITKIRNQLEGQNAL